MFASKSVSYAVVDFVARLLSLKSEHNIPTHPEEARLLTLCWTPYEDLSMLVLRLSSELLLWLIPSLFDVGNSSCQNVLNSII